MPAKEEFNSISSGPTVSIECKEKEQHVHTSDLPKIRYANSKHINFYKHHDIKAYKRPVYQTKIISSPEEIDKTDFFYHGQGYIMKRMETEDDLSVIVKSQKKVKVHLSHKSSEEKIRMKFL